MAFETDPKILQPHAAFGGAAWQLTTMGVLVGSDHVPVGSGGPPLTVRNVWQKWGPDVAAAAEEFDVPIELIVACICTESRGNPSAERAEPGFTSYEATPSRVSIGLMQTLISTARSMAKTFGVPSSSVTPSWLRTGRNSIRAGTAYIASQAATTHLDPPKVACAYNAGGLYEQTGAHNRWRMRQFPIGTGAHADRFVQWFNDCFIAFDDPAKLPDPSYVKALNGVVRARRGAASPTRGAARPSARA